MQRINLKTVKGITGDLATDYALLRLTSVLADIASRDWSDTLRWEGLEEVSEVEAHGIQRTS